ncbi:MAG: hypothetical protein AB1426_12650 [Bacillota bacterium]
MPGSRFDAPDPETQRPPPETPGNVLVKLRPGDRVSVEWNCKQDRGGYGGEGTVMQVTARQVVIKHPLRYTFCVTRAHLISGTKITLIRKEDTEMADLHLSGENLREYERPVEEPEQMSLPGEPLREDRTPAESPEQSPHADGPPTPVEALERGLPLTTARVMTPADLTKETAEKLLAAGVTKREIMRLYSYRSSQGFFGRLQKWGLHKSAVAKSSKKTPAKPRGKEVSLEEAIRTLDRARENLKSVKLIIKREKDLLTEDLTARLAAIEKEFAEEVSRFETALKNTKVVV